ncbi:hypothetical protein BC628DRAFT_1373753 [Trametes gibbosa]|nr:hypothetical protein BC628DRAFT_1373753 [Trametes gibbosa]
MPHSVDQDEGRGRENASVIVAAGSTRSVSVSASCVSAGFPRPCSAVARRGGGVGKVAVLLDASLRLCLQLKLEWGCICVLNCTTQRTSPPLGTLSVSGTRACITIIIAVFTRGVAGASSGVFSAIRSLAASLEWLRLSSVHISLSSRPFRLVFSVLCSCRLGLHLYDTHDLLLPLIPPITTPVCLATKCSRLVQAGAPRRGRPGLTVCAINMFFPTGQGGMKRRVCLVRRVAVDRSTCILLSLNL